MRKLSFVICALFLAVGANAQKVSADEIGVSQTTTSLTDPGNGEVDDNGKSGGGIDYMVVEDGFGMDYSLAVKHFLLDFTYADMDNDYGSGTRWTLGLGGQYRYWLTKGLFIEGRLGVEYLHASSKMKGSEEEFKDDKFGLFLTPRLGYELYKGWSVVAGYRWDFIDFKFDKDHTADCFTVGLCIVI